MFQALNFFLSVLFIFSLANMIDLLHTSHPSNYLKPSDGAMHVSKKAICVLLLRVDY